MDEELIRTANDYAGAHGRALGEQLGFGIHGIVIVLKSERQLGDTALKVLSGAEPYQRERDVYKRLGEEGITKIRGFHVPHMIRFDDARLAIEMTIVMPPHVLDFAGAFLDWPPEFSEEIWAEWTGKNEEQFGNDWPLAQTILRDLERLQIFMLDPSPSNIRFR